MNTMKWLVRREFWEHKGSMFWAPLVVAGLMLLFLLLSVGYGWTVNPHAQVTINGQQVDMAAHLSQMAPEARRGLASAIAGGYMAFSAPLLLMMTFVVFFYCLGALYEERRDRSILLWKSLPLSDQATVLSKAITALCVAPLITLTIAIATSFIVLCGTLIVLAINGLNLIATVATSPSIYLMPLQLILLLPVYILWALPTVGWLLMVSSWAKSKVFLWAVGMPLMAALVIKWSNALSGTGIDIRWFMENVLLRGLGGLVPGLWLASSEVRSHVMMHAGDHTVDMSGVLLQSYMTLGHAEVWIGAAVGVAMLYAAVRLRRWKDEG